MANEHITYINGESQFNSEVLESDKPVLVDFWAEWCQPCHAMAPVIEKIADEHNDKLKVAKVDTDRNLALSQKYQIFSIPTLMVVKGGQIVKQQPGFVPEDRVKALLAEAGVEL